MLLSPVSRLPYWSSSETTGWVVKTWPTVAVADGSWVMTNWVAGPGALVRLKLAGVAAPAAEAVTV